jgi:hypothetical protein
VDSGLDNSQDVERRLTVARRRLDQARKHAGPGHRRDEWQEFATARQDVLRLERLLAKLKAEEYAEPIEFPVEWSTGAPLPHLFVDDDRALLAFLVDVPDPAWDGTNPVPKSPAGNEPETVAVVEFDRCVSAKLGSPNDEALAGHPLYGKGLEFYAAQQVINSRWLKEIEAINSAHPMYRHSFWSDLKHFIFWFHDSTFECLAESFQVEVHRMRMRDLLSRMVDHLIS